MATAKKHFQNEHEFNNEKEWVIVLIVGVIFSMAEEG
jgi:hypothetical protein